MKSQERTFPPATKVKSVKMLAASEVRTMQGAFQNSRKGGKVKGDSDNYPVAVIYQ